MDGGSESPSCLSWALIQFDSGCPGWLNNSWPRLLRPDGLAPTLTRPEEPFRLLTDDTLWRAANSSANCGFPTRINQQSKKVGRVFSLADLSKRHRSSQNRDSCLEWHFLKAPAMRLSWSKRLLMERTGGLGSGFHLRVGSFDTWSVDDKLWSFCRLGSSGQHPGPCEYQVQSFVLMDRRR